MGNWTDPLQVNPLVCRLRDLICLRNRGQSTEEIPPNSFYHQYLTISLLNPKREIIIIINNNNNNNNVGAQRGKEKQKEKPRLVVSDIPRVVGGVVRVDCSPIPFLRVAIIHSCS
jgi:hypothetical protein